MARGIAKLNAAVASSMQDELFGSLSEMAADPTDAFVSGEAARALAMLQDLAPASPATAVWGEIWPKILERCVVRKSQLNALAGNLRKSGQLKFVDWPPRKRSPEDNYRFHRV
jgi:hypothetical protein